MDRPLISEHEMIKETEIFFKIYSEFIDEIDQIESVRGKLNDFQLMQAVSRAKENMGILGWERRQTVNSIFEKYMHIYRIFGRAKADEWVKVTFVYSIKMRNDIEPEAPTELPKLENSLSANEETSSNHKNAESRIQELSRLILEKEAELLQLYREFYLLQQGF
jgi:hypothetical protein